MIHPVDYKIITVSPAYNHILITVPTGETSIQRVRQDILNSFGSDCELTELSLSECNTLLDPVKDRIFRNTWQLNNNQIIEPLEDCQRIIRESRNQALEYLDNKAYSESRKPNNSKIELINTYAQELRDIPQSQLFSSSNRADLVGLINRIKQIKSLV
jgi:hypothetical protein